MTMSPLRILVTGSRTATPEQSGYVWEILDRVSGPALALGRPVTVVQGECPYGGVDLAARKWADETSGVTGEPHPADWDRHGKAAGMIRNAEMVTAGASVCLAFPRPASRGTWDCIRKAADAGIIVRIYPLR